VIEQNFIIISQLDQRYAAEVEDIITSPPQQDPFSKLRTELLKRLSLLREQRAHRILTLEEMGDRKPSQFLRQLRSLVPDLPDYFLRTIWTIRLPANVQATLGCRAQGNYHSRRQRGRTSALQPPAASSSPTSPLSSDS
jgi:hypothetical protein